MGWDTDQTTKLVDFAVIVGCSPGALSKFVERGIIAAHRPLGENLLAYCSSLRETAAGRDAGLAAEKAIHEKQKTALTRIRVERAAGRWAPIDVLSSALSSTCSQMASALNRVEPELRRAGVDHDVIRIVRRAIADARNVAVTAALDNAATVAAETTGYAAELLGNDDEQDGR